MSDEKDTRVAQKKFSDFSVATGEDIEGVGLKGGQNVRFALTTDAISVNPNTFRNDKGQFIGTPDELESLKNQRDVNEFFYNAINDIEAGDVNLDGYATEEWVADQIDALDPYDDTAINEALAAEIATREAEDQALQAQIDGIETDLSGYLPLSGGEMEGSAQIKVNNIAPVNTTSIKYDGSASGHPMSLMNRGMISDFIDEKTEDFASVEYVDNADRILDAEIQELALALNTLLAQRDHGQWEYVGLLQDAIPRNPGQFSLQDAFTSEENVMVLNSEDLNGTTHALGTVNVGDYVEVVDLENPDNNVLYVVTDDDLGSGTLLEVSVSLRASSGEIKVGDKCEVRFFAINQEDIGIADLDARYLKLTGGTLTGTLKAPRVEAQKLEGGEAMMLIEGKLANNDPAARLTFSNKTNPNAYGSLTWQGTSGTGWFQFNKDLDMSGKGLHSVGRVRLTGDKTICEGNSNRILLDEKVVITKVSGNGAGFTVKGKTNAGNNGDLLYVYHNSTGLDAINYAGKQDSAANLATVGYVNNAVSAIPAPTVGRRFKYGDGSSPADGYFSINGGDILFSFVDLGGVTRKMTSGPDFGWTNFARMTVWNAEGELWYAAELTRSTNYSTTMLRLYKESVKLDRTLVVDEEYSITIEGYW